MLAREAAWRGEQAELEAHAAVVEEALAAAEVSRSILYVGHSHRSTSLPSSYIHGSCILCHSHRSLPYPHIYTCTTQDGEAALLSRCQDLEGEVAHLEERLAAALAEAAVHQATTATLWRRLEAAEGGKQDAEARAAMGEATNAALWGRLEGAHREMAGLVEGKELVEARVLEVEEVGCGMVVWFCYVGIDVCSRS